VNGLHSSNTRLSGTLLNHRSSSKVESSASRPHSECTFVACWPCRCFLTLANADSLFLTLTCTQLLPDQPCLTYVQLRSVPFSFAQGDEFLILREQRCSCFCTCSSSALWHPYPTALCGSHLRASYAALTSAALDSTDVDSLVQFGIHNPKPSCCSVCICRKRPVLSTCPIQTGSSTQSFLPCLVY
jgi:hypothetical protein